MSHTPPAAPPPPPAQPAPSTQLRQPAPPDVAEFSPRGLRCYMAHPDHVLLFLIVAAVGLVVGRWDALGEGLAAVGFGSLALAWLADLNGVHQYGRAWTRYRQAVRWWWPRWKPWHRSLDDAALPPARAYFAESCLTCSAGARWVKAQQPVGMAIHAAEDHPTETLSRMSFDPMNGEPEERGMLGFCRVLEHLNFVYALCGTAGRLPVVRWVVQIVTDALGGGPRYIPRRPQPPRTI